MQSQLILPFSLTAFSGGDTQQQLSPHLEDKPAPLFSGKSRAKDSSASAPKSSEEDEASEGLQHTHTADDNESSLAQQQEQEDQEYVPYEVDIDGTPVVGDLLKMMFVEHRVVPTILVRLEKPQSDYLSYLPRSRTTFFDFLGTISYITSFMMLYNKFSTVK
jgi:hypothetical protein